MHFSMRPMKRISGNYFDHLLSILIYYLTFGWVLLLIDGIEMEILVLVSICVILFIWTAVSLKIYLTGKVNSSLNVDIKKNQLVFKDHCVEPSEIETISIYTYKAGRYRYTYIDFTILSKGIKFNYRIQNMISLTLLDIWFKHPKSLMRLFEYFPELEKKVEEKTSTKNN